MAALRPSFLVVALALLVAGPVPAQPTTPDGLVNFQGVLRDVETGAPLTGELEMIFSFYDQPQDGLLLLIDQHLGAQAVLVESGLFQVLLGSGNVQDGQGGDDFGSLADVLRQFPQVWMEIRVGEEVLAPRIRLAAVPAALNADMVDGRQGSELLDTTGAPQAKTGPLSLSGATTITGPLRIASGGPGSGLVLTADGSGNASWQPPPPGPEGPEGPQGPPGLPGIQGPPGPAGPVAGYELVRSNSGVALCPPGKVALGGSCQCSGSGLNLDNSYLDLTPQGHAWRCNCDGTSVVTTAICAEATPFCGDGIRNGEEECDGLDDGLCLTTCQADCSCEICGNGTCDPGESCSNCIADCGFCFSRDLYETCDNVNLFCASPAQCNLQFGFCTVPCTFSLNSNDCQYDPDFEEACFLGGASPATGFPDECVALCRDDGSGILTCPNDLVCDTASGLCLAPAP